MLNTVYQLGFKQYFDIWGNSLIHFLAELDEKIDTTKVSMQNFNVNRNKLR